MTVGGVHEHPDVALEDFESDDPEFLALAANENLRRHALGHSWWRHERHPKHYLMHLAGQSDDFYEEKDGGREALLELDWPSLPAGEDTLCFARSLFQDLADQFRVQSPLGDGSTHDLTYPALAIHRVTLTLRNL